MLSRNELCWCGSGKKWKKCHFPELDHNVSSRLAEKYLKSYGIILKTEEQIQGIKEACALAAKILQATAKQAVAGITTEELDAFALKMHQQAGAIAAPFGYGSPPFPKHICTSLNDVICHGIPDATILKNGDILNIDVTCILNGFYGDCSCMVMIGDVDEEKQNVVDVSYQCLMRSIALIKPGAFLHVIGDEIQAYADAHGCSVVNQFVGHGVGLHFHEAPQVPHYSNRLAIPFAPGMIFTVEPMINAGVQEGYIDKKDRWTARTCDGRPSAQWEHTLLVTETGVEILTPWIR